MLSLEQCESSRHRHCQQAFLKAPVVIDVGPKAVRSKPARRRHCRSLCCWALPVLVVVTQMVHIGQYESGTAGGAPHTARHPLEERQRPHPPRSEPELATLQLPKDEMQLASGAHGADSSAATEDDAAQQRGDLGDPRSPLLIQKLVHQSWRDGGFPKTMFNWRWQAGLVALNEGWTLMRWTDNSSRQLIADEYNWFLPAYDAYPSYIQRSDAARYFIVYHYGGVYADLDIECFRPFGPVLAGRRVVLSYKQGTNMSRGLVNAIFASEARHPFWLSVFPMLSKRAEQGARAATHVEVIRSTGPGLLRAAVEELQRTSELDALGVVLIHSRVWHPIMPEQKHGRDTSPEVRRLINQSHCYHHFVSSWIQHDRERHNNTLTSRRGGPNGSIVVPTGQTIRSSNPWRSFGEHLEEMEHAAEMSTT